MIEVGGTEALRRDLRDANERIKNLEEVLQAVTDHFAAVMGGGLISRYIKFENGVEGIPTIAHARQLIAKSLL